MRQCIKSSVNEPRPLLWTPVGFADISFTAIYCSGKHNLALYIPPYHRGVLEIDLVVGVIHFQIFIPTIGAIFHFEGIVRLSQYITSRPPTVVLDRLAFAWLVYGKSIQRWRVQLRQWSISFGHCKRSVRWLVPLLYVNLLHTSLLTQPPVLYCTLCLPESRTKAYRFLRSQR